MTRLKVQIRDTIPEPTLLTRLTRLPTQLQGRPVTLYHTTLQPYSSSPSADPLETCISGPRPFDPLLLLFSPYTRLEREAAPPHSSLLLLLLLSSTPLPSSPPISPRPFSSIPPERSETGLQVEIQPTTSRLSTKSCIRCTSSPVESCPSASASTLTSSAFVNSNGESPPNLTVEVNSLASSVRVP